MNNEYSLTLMAPRVNGVRILTHSKDTFNDCLANSGPFGTGEGYLGLFTYGHEMADHLEAYGTTAGFRGPLFADFLWLDIDRPNDLEGAYGDTARLLLEADVLLGGQPAMAFYSGAKGFHVGIPLAAFGDAPKPGPNFHKQARAVACALAKRAHVKIDTAIYDPVRLFRAPNTKHPKSGKYKIPLHPAELVAYRLFTIQAVADKPRPRADWTADVKPTEAAANFWRAAAGAVDDWTPTTPKTEQTECSDKPDKPTCCLCEKQILTTGETVPRLRRATRDFLFVGPLEGERNNGLFQAVCDCVRCGWSATVVWSLFPDIGRKLGLSRSEVEATIKSALRTEGATGE